MKYLLIPLLSLTFYLGSPSLQADCTRPPQGDPGFLSAHYIGSYSDTVQSLGNGEPVNVSFPLDSTLPAGILKAGTTNFIIQQTGVYLIYWTVNGQTQHVNNPPNILELNLKVNGIPVMSMPSSKTSFPNFLNAPPLNANLSGRVTLVLQKNDVITLEALATFTNIGEDMQINSALIDILQIPSLL